ncbi:hypothetical protein [Amycolatopsis coloradensis]|nr:hypothetical protein [Amycolatopsis coloradensis]
MAAEGVLRFVMVRPAKLPPPTAAGVVVGETGVESPLFQRLREAADAGQDRESLAQLAREHGTEHPADEVDVSPLLARLDEAEDRTVADVDLDATAQEVYGRSLADLVTSDEFRAAETRAADALVAGALLGEPGAESDTRALKAIALARAVTEGQAPGEPVREYLARTPVMLPDLVRRAPIPVSPPTVRAEPERDWLSALDTAHREIAALVLDDRYQAAAPEADHGPDTPGSPTRRSSTPGLRLTPDALTGLSQSTREVAERLGLARDVLDPVRAIALIEAEIQSASTRTTGPVVSFTGGMVDVAEFKQSMAVQAVPPTGSFQAGVADLLVLRQKIKAYELGEFAHIENVMSGETRERNTRRLSQREQVTETESESETEKERDLSSTQRNELQNEAQKTVKSSTEIEAGLQVTGSYGPAVSFTASLKAGFSSSTEEAQRKASSFSQEVTQRTVEKVRESVRSLVRLRTLEEFEETNGHAFANSNPLKHIRGIYRWLNKVYDAQVFNYGQRMMFDFVVPEPAAYFLHALVENPPKNSDLVKPQPPDFFGQALKPSHLTRTNYHDYVARYRVANVPAPPPQFQTVAFFEKQDGSDATVNIGRAGKLDVPAGYQTFHATVQTDYVFPVDGESHTFRVVVGGSSFDRTEFWGAEGKTLNAHQKELSIAFKLLHVRAFAIGIDVQCTLTDEGFARWQHQVYDAVIQAYQQQLAEYQDRQAQTELQQGTKAFGNNPLVNVRIVRDELKRWLIMMLTGNADLNLDSFQPSVPGTDPRLNLPAAYDNGKFIRFFENAFEWHNILYICYPHLWGRRARWINALNLSDPDPDFAAFLRAGAARVQVPVRPGFEAAVAYYAQTGVIWDGNDVPSVNDPLYLPIVKEITENLGKLDNGVPYPAGSKPWEVNMPTDLVLVQNVDEVPPLRDALSNKQVNLAATDATTEE